jgi:hypothetical protein
MLLDACETTMQQDEYATCTCMSWEHVTCCNDCLLQEQYAHIAAPGASDPARPCKQQIEATNAPLDVSGDSQDKGGYECM